MPSRFFPSLPALGQSRLHADPAHGPSRPLHGITILLVEDSRFASDAIRLITTRLGGRLRRADCLDSAGLHLAAYDPDVVIVDLGLPDGRGEDLIRHLAPEPDPRAVLLGTSGDPDGAAFALAAGADGFLPKPLPSLSAFLALVLPDMPASTLIPANSPDPDPMALRDDLRHAQGLLLQARSDDDRDYLAGFLSGLGNGSGDHTLMLAANRLRQGHIPANLPALLESRIASTCLI